MLTHQITRLAIGLSLGLMLAGQAPPTTKPKVPIGAPVQGFAAALLSTGVDYTRPEITSRLARDGEGEIIGWDTIDNDRRPFQASPNLTPAAEGGDATALSALAAVRLVHVRVALSKPESLAQAVEFVARSPARVVLVPMGSADRASWEAFRAAVEAKPGLLFVVAAGDDGADIDATPVYPAAFRLPNMLVVSAVAPTGAKERPNTGAKSVDVIIAPPSALRESPGSSQQSPNTSREATLAAAAMFVCYARDLAQSKSPADARQILLTKAKTQAGFSSPVLEACTPPR
jgi:Subtilase family